MGKDRVLLLISHQENQRLLAERLSPKAEVIVPSSEDLQLMSMSEAAVDMIIFDGVELGKWRSQLQSWRQSAEPLLLPVMVLLPKNALGGLPPALRGQIDDVLTLPVDPNELDMRMAVLLRSRHLSKQLTQQNQRLEELNRLKSRFVSVVSHEFRNPLSVISSIAQLLEARGPSLSDAKRKDFHKRLNGSVSKLTQLLDNLLVFNRNDSAKTAFNPALLDLNQHCKMLIANLQLSQDQNAAKNTTVRKIEFQSQGDLSALYADSALIETILTNLLSNALKYSPLQKPVVLSVERFESDDDNVKSSVIFEIEDQGRGIPLADQPALFETFFRASNVGETPGTGLGLSIVKQCVDLHGGTVKVYSEVDKGTVFTVQLPCGAKASKGTA